MTLNPVHQKKDAYLKWRLIAAISSSIVTGLVKWMSAPALRARSLCLALPQAETTMMGISAVSGPLRN